MTVTIRYAGHCREQWDENYHLTVLYEDRKSLNMCFAEGRWEPTGALPEHPFADRFFREAADAVVAAERFLATGLRAQSLRALSPSGGDGVLFRAEVLRILIDDCGLRMETVYPYVAFGEPVTDADGTVEAGTDAWSLSAEELGLLAELQPRTAHLLEMLQGMRERVPAVRHDLRLPEYRSPVGAVRTGEMLTLAVRCDPVGAAVLELYGDDVTGEYPMERTETGFRTEIPTPVEPVALWYRFRLEREGKTLWLCAAPDGQHGWLYGVPEEGFRLTVYQRDFQTPEWFQHAVLYQIFPDRFAFSEDGGAEAGIAYHRSLGQTPELHAGRDEEPRWQPRPFESTYTPDDFYGGRLSAIREKLPYLKALGVTSLYLNPIVEARSNHRYDASDYLRVDPILGSNEDFQALCDAAARLGIRILCDGVFSHTGADSIYFNRDGHYPNPGACQSEPSPWDSWYAFEHFPDGYKSWWGFRELPEVNEHDPAWQDYIVRGENSVVRTWLRRGASGWRLDVADELPNDVLLLIRKAAKEEKSDAVVLGEVWEDAVLKESYGARRTYALGTSLDSVMNYPFRTAVLDFLHGKADAFALADFLTGQQMHYPGPIYRSLMNLLGSHDVERLRTALATDTVWKSLPREKQLRLEAALPAEAWERAARLERLALAIQYSIPGVPSIYYGEELGMRGVNDPFNRRPMPDDLQAGLRSEQARLAKIRNASDALQNGDAFFYAADHDVAVILRVSENERVYTAVNRSAEEREVLLYFDGTEKTVQVPPEGAVFCEPF